MGAVLLRGLGRVSDCFRNKSLKLLECFLGVGGAEVSVGPLCRGRGWGLTCSGCLYAAWTARQQNLRTQRGQLPAASSFWTSGLSFSFRGSMTPACRTDTTVRNLSLKPEKDHQNCKDVQHNFPLLCLTRANLMSYAFKGKVKQFATQAQKYNYQIGKK